MSVSIVKPVLVEQGAINQVAPYLAGKGYTIAAIIADSNTIKAIGSELIRSIEARGIQVSITLIKPNKLGDVLADEQSIVQALLDLRKHAAEIVIAVGTGTLHDITRFSAYTVGIPFISVPTAPSVDGFNSIGAPLIIRGDKITIPAIGPSAIFADLNVLMNAPDQMIAAGFGDMLGKYTSLFDWEYGHLTGDEPYSKEVADRTRQALQSCIDHIDEIAIRSLKGVEVLILALLESGFAMLQFGQSHPASGSEHHLSHYWEMEFIRTGRKQILHGAKVGVACTEISGLYHRLAEENPAFFPLEHRETLLNAISQIPPEGALKKLLQKVGSPVSIQELDVSKELLAMSLKEAHLIRPHRQTLLKRANQ